MVIKKVTVDQVRRIRANNPGMGLFNAKHIAIRQNLLDAVEEAQTIDDLKLILRETLQTVPRSRI